MTNYFEEIYKTIADLYIIEKYSIAKACTKLGITPKTYYNICNKLKYSSIATKKDARLNFLAIENNTVPNTRIKLSDEEIAIIEAQNLTKFL